MCWKNSPENQRELAHEYGLHRAGELDNQRLQVVLCLVQVFALGVELAVALKYALVFLNRAEADVP